MKGWAERNNLRLSLCVICEFDQDEGLSPPPQAPYFHPDPLSQAWRRDWDQQKDADGFFMKPKS